MKRRVRAVRQRSLAIELTPRDRAMLVCIGLMRYLAADQLAGEFFTSHDRCRRRLRQLYDAGLVTVTVVGSNRPAVVSLTAEGLHVVADSDPALASTLRLPGALRVAGLGHHIVGCDVRLYLGALARAGGPELIRWLNTETVAPADRSRRAAELVADAVAEMSVRGAEHRVAVEVDMGSEVLSTVESKCSRYVSAFASGTVHELWFVVDGEASRCLHIADLLRAAGLAHVARVMPRTHVTARPVRPPLPRVEAADRVEDPNSMSLSAQNTLQSRRFRA